MDVFTQGRVNHIRVDDVQAKSSPAGYTTTSRRRLTASSSSAGRFFIGPGFTLPLYRSTWAEAHCA